MLVEYFTLRLQCGDGVDGLFRVLPMKADGHGGGWDRGGGVDIHLAWCDAAIESQHFSLNHMRTHYYQGEVGFRLSNICLNKGQRGKI